MSMIWHSKTLDELCDFKNGLWKGKKEPFIHVGVIRNTNFTKNGQLNDSDIAYLDVESKQYSSRKLEYGDLILEKSGGGPKQPVGRVIPFEKKEGEFSFSNFTSIIRVLNKEELDFLYLHRYLHFLYLSGKTESMQKHSTGIRNLQLKEYKNIEVPLPSLKEQKRIVAILDEAFAGIDTAIANTERNLANARELFESYLNSLFRNAGDGWTHSTLGEVCNFQGGSQPPKSEFVPDLKEGCIRLIQIRDYKSDKNIVYIPKEKTKRFCDKTDVMIGRYGPPLFQILRGLEGAYNVALMKAIPDEKKLSKDFLYYFLKNGDILNYIVNASSRAAGQSGINKATIEPYPIAYPSQEEQASIVSSLNGLHEDIQRLETIYQEKLAALKELKQSLLQKAFSGDLTAEGDKLMDEAVA